MPSQPPTIFLCYESHDRVLAERLVEWPRANADLAVYASRTVTSPTVRQSAGHRRRIRQQIAASDVLVCLIGEDTWRDEWVAWELHQARRCTRVGLVGVLLQSWHLRPDNLTNVGAIFVPFRRDRLQRAIRWAATEHFDADDFTLVDD